MGVRDLKVQMGSVNIHIVLQLFARCSRASRYCYLLANSRFRLSSIL